MKSYHLLKKQTNVFSNDIWHHIRSQEIVVFILGGILASLLFVFLYGFKILNPMYDGWLYYGFNRSDLILHYYGWLFFRKSDWLFPLGMMNGITYPDELSIIYTDSIPLFALFFKLLSPVLPETFQYMGFFGFTSFFLMGGSTSLCIFILTNDSLYSVIASLLFDSSLIFVMRMFYHTALSAQWLIIFSIIIFLKKENAWNTRKSIFIWGLLSVLSVSIQAYFFPMVFGIQLCSMCKHLIHTENKKSAIFRAVSTPIVSVILVIITGFVLGFFAGSVSGSGSGLGDYSFNYNSFFNTYGYSAFFESLPYVHWGQYEGYCYLGLGIYLMLLFSIVVFFIKLKKKQVNNIQINLINTLPYILYILGFTVFAAGPLFSFGNRYYYYHLPENVLRFWSFFRSTGRFIWPVAYLLMFFIIAFAYRVLINSRSVYCIVCVTVIIQLIENYPYLNAIRMHYFNTNYEYFSSLSDPIWNEIADRCDHIVFYPDVSKQFCVYEIQMEAQELMIYAEKNGMTTNTNFICRDISSIKNEDVYMLFETEKSFDDQTLYVFLDEFPENETSLYYYSIDGIEIGLTYPL